MMCALAARYGPEDLREHPVSAEHAIDALIASIQARISTLERQHASQRAPLEEPPGDNGAEIGARIEWGGAHSPR